MKDKTSKTLPPPCVSIRKVSVGLSVIAWSIIAIPCASGTQLSGMEMGSVIGNTNQLTITSTGAQYVLSRTNMAMWRLIDPASNAVNPRLVANLVFDSDLGPLSIESTNDDYCVAQSSLATFEFHGDSLFFVTAKSAFNYTHTNLIADAPWNRGTNFDRMWTDGYGGSLHASVTGSPALVTSGINATTMGMTTSVQMAHMVFPPKPFDFESLYGTNVRPFVDFIYNSAAMAARTNDLTPYMNDHFGVFAIFHGFYTDEYRPVLLSPSLIGYKIEPAYDALAREFIDVVHSNGFKVIAYAQIWNGSGNWRYPGGDPKEGQNQDMAVTLQWMRDFQADYGFDGWYFDNADAGGFMEDYNFIRQVRSDIGEDGIIYHHDSVDVWGEWMGIRAVMVDSYVNYTLAGETGVEGEVDHPNELYMRFFTAAYGMSQALASHKRMSYYRTAISEGEKNRVIAQNLHGAERTLNAWWTLTYSPAYEHRKAEYLSGAFNPDVDWPLDPATSWFRMPPAVNVAYPSESSITVSWNTQEPGDGEIAYATNGVWWQPGGVVLSASVSDSSMATGHSLTMSNLDFSKLHEFRIRSSNGEEGTNEIIWGHVFTLKSPGISNGAGASNVSATASYLNGNLFSTGAAPTTVFVFWGRNDGATIESAWEHTNNLGLKDTGPITTGVSGLDPDCAYYYRFYATNSYGECWAYGTETFITGEIWVEASDSTATELAGDTGMFQISRPDTGTNASLTVNYATTGTASSGVDYIALTGAVIIAAGRTNATVHVIPLEDGDDMESDETLTLTLMPGAYRVGSPGNATVTISNTVRADWRYAMKIAFTGYDRNETLTNFPALIVFSDSLTNFNYDQFASTNGYDLRFRDNAETAELNYEIDEWHTNNDSYVWVQLPEMSGTNTAIWAYWGNTNAVESAIHGTNGATWSDGYLGVWHMSRTNARDSTTSGIDGTSRGNICVEGKIGIAQGFDGNDHIDCGDQAGTLISDPTGSDISFGLWIRPDDLLSTPCVLSSGAHTASRGITMYINNSEKAVVLVSERDRSANSGYVVPIGYGDWVYVVVTYDTTINEMTVYTNGAVFASYAATGVNYSDTETAFQIGKRPDTDSNYFYGAMDEMRISAMARSSNWVWASWKNQMSNGSFVSYGTTERNSVDADHDGMADEWEIHHWGSAGAPDADPFADPDHDGFLNLSEHIAGTNPTNAESALRILGMAHDAGLTHIEWQGGTSAWQYVESKQDLISTTETWRAIFTNPPPTSFLTNILHLDATNKTLYYRIKVKQSP